MKPGDEVRFLDSVGGGIVSRVLEQKKIVYVRDQDGFEIPVKISQVVVVESERKPNNTQLPQLAPQPSPHAAQPQASQPEPLTDDIDEEIYETDYGDTMLLQLAFMPQNIRLLQSTPYDAILINDSNYFIYYTIASIGDNKQGHIIANGFLEPNMTDTFATISKDQLNEWHLLRIQAIPFKQQKDYLLQRVIDVELKLNLVNFFKLHAFTSNEYFDQPAWLINLMTKPNVEPEEESQLEESKPRHRRILPQQ